jgi:hypothetical protein
MRSSLGRIIYRILHFFYVLSIESMKRVVNICFFSVGLSAGVFEIPFRRALDGSFIVESRIVNCGEGTFVDMQLDLGNFSWMRECFTRCSISFPTISGFNDLLFHDPDAFYNRREIASQAIAIGPRSHMTRFHGGIDVIQSDMLVRFGGSLHNFISTFCAADTYLEIRTVSTDTQSVFPARFELVDSVSGEFLNTTISGPVLVAAEECVGQNSFAIFPLFLGSRLDAILRSHGAIRVDPHAGVTPGIWSYTNCTNETLSFLPNLVIEFFNETGALRGSIILAPSEYISNCEFRVNDGTIEHVVNDQTFLSLDFFKIPETNIRIENNRIFICDSLI